MHSEAKSRPLKTLISDLEVKLGDETSRKLDEKNNGDIDVPRNGLAKAFLYESDAILKSPLKRLHFAQKERGGAGGDESGDVEDQGKTAKRMRTEQNDL